MKPKYKQKQNFLLKDEIKYLNSKLHHIPWQEKSITSSTWVSGGFETTINAHPEWVLPLLEHMKSSFKIEFNYILYSKYSSLNHSSAPSQNNDFYLGESPVTPILGVGNSIPLEITNKYTYEIERLELKNNDLFLINPEQQNEWLIAIPKGNLLVEPHYSLSFRKVIHSSGDEAYSNL